MNVYIKEILAQKGLTQKDIAEKLGVTQSNISATISATISRPSFPTLERIVAVLNVEPTPRPSLGCGRAEASTRRA